MDTTTMRNPYSKELIDLGNDRDYAYLCSIIKEGSILDIPRSTNFTILLEKQAAEDSSHFADPANRLFCISTRNETEISARYAEKQAKYIEDYVIANINDAAEFFGVKGVEPVKMASVLGNHEARDMFNSVAVDEGSKYASCTTYGTELANCIYSRIAHFPDFEEDYRSVLKYASTIDAEDMLGILKELDAVSGADAPNVIHKVGSADYAIFEKRPSHIVVNLDGVEVPFEDLVENADKIASIGVQLDFDVHEPYEIRNAVEALPVSTKRYISSIIRGV